MASPAVWRQLREATAAAAVESFENCEPEDIMAIISSIDMAERGARLWGESSKDIKDPGWLYWRDDMVVVVVEVVVKVVLVGVVSLLLLLLLLLVSWTG